MRAHDTEPGAARPARAAPLPHRSDLRPLPPELAGWARGWVEGWGGHMSKGYVYFAMAFSLGVELLNMWFRKRHKPVTLYSKMSPAP